MLENECPSSIERYRTLYKSWNKLSWLKGWVFTYFNSTEKFLYLSLHTTASICATKQNTKNCKEIVFRKTSMKSTVMNLSENSLKNQHTAVIAKISFGVLESKDINVNFAALLCTRDVMSLFVLFAWVKKKGSIQTAMNWYTIFWSILSKALHFVTTVDPCFMV